MNTKLVSMALLAAGLIGINAPLVGKEPVKPAHSAAATVPDPAMQIRDVARLFRSGDLLGLAQTMLPPSKWEEIRLVYELKRLEPVSDEDRIEFAENIDRVIAPQAVDDLMAQIEPELEKARPQAAGALLVGFGALQMAVASPESELTDDQRAALRSALPGFQQWASSTDFLDSATMRQALMLITGAARGVGINDIDQLKAMPLEDVLNRASPVLSAAKDAVRLYGIDLDAVADSLRVDVLEIDGDTARVRTTVTLFNAPIWSEHDLVLVEGRWYGKHAVQQWSHHHSHDVDG